VVGRDEFAVHSLVLRTISPFFENALCGTFKEANTKRLHIGETTSRAVHVLLDYAYEIPGFTHKLGDPHMAREVWELAHRFDVRGLGELCAVRLLAQMSLENAVEMMQSVKELDCSIHIVNFIARNFSTTKNVYHLDEDSLKSVLISPYLAATEMELISIIKQWTEYHNHPISGANNNNNNRNGRISQLLELIRFELLTLQETATIFSDGVAWIPKQSLMRALKARKECEERMGVFNMLKNPPLPYGSSSNDSRWIAETSRRSLIVPEYKDMHTVLLPIPAVENGRFTHPPIPVYFEFYEWILSACVHEGFGEIGYRIVFERRKSPENGAPNDQVLKNTKFKISTKLSGINVTTEDFPIMFRPYHRPPVPHGKTWYFRVQTQTKLEAVKGVMYALISLEA